MRIALFILAVVLAACTSPSVLQDGRWTGTLTPMNHPEMANSVAYDVRHDEDGLSIDLIGPGGGAIQTRDPHLKRDTLFFSFEEPEEQVRLRCALGRDGAGFAGRCRDAEGKWARFTMVPPR